MTIFKKNLQTLAQYYPGMDQLILEAQRDVIFDLCLQDEVAFDGTRILKIIKKDQTLYLNGIRDAKDPAKKWVASLGELQENAPILMMGIGNETYLQELAENTCNHLAIIIYEPSLQIFIDFLEHTDLEWIMQRHTVIFWVEGLENMGLGTLEWVIRSVLIYEMLPFSRVFILPNYDILFPEKTLTFMKKCCHIAGEEEVSFNTKVRFEGVFVKNLFANTVFLCDGYKTTQLTQVIPRNIPGIVVAAGPSLNRNIQELKRAKGKAFIIATDTALKPLLNAGIVPDMFAIVDAKKPLTLVEVEEAKEIPVSTTLDASSAVLNYHTGMKFFANEGVAFVDRLFARCDKNIGLAAEGGSVATAAFTLLYKIGIQTIILVGQDLALTGNRSHADGTFQEKMPELDTRNSIFVEGNNGEQVPTRSDFQIYLQWYNMYIKGCQKYDSKFRVINATEGGAKIDNTEIMTLKDAIDRECTTEVNIQECLKKLHPLFEGEDRRWVIAQLKEIPNNCLKLSQDAQKVVRLYKKLGNLCQKRILNQKAYKNILKQLKKHIKQIEKQEMYQLVTCTLNEAQYIIKNEQFLSYDSVQEEGKEIARKGILYMENVSKCALIFQEYAESIYGNWEIN